MLDLYVKGSGAGGGIRTHERLRDRVLSPAPLTRLGDPCNAIVLNTLNFVFFTPFLRGDKPSCFVTLCSMWVFLK